MPTKDKIEASLVSMAGTLIYLQGLLEILSKKPMVPQSVQTLMPATQAKLTELQRQISEVQAVASSEAQPTLVQWLAAVRLPIGGCIKFSTMFRGETLQVSAGIESAQLSPTMLSGIRVVDITLAGAEIQRKDGTIVNFVSDLNGAVAHTNAVIRDVRGRDAITGVMATSLHVRVPIQAKQRGTLAMSGALELL